MANKRLMIIDTDAGVDDANAILMALSYPDVEVVGITTVSGNILVKQVTVNVLRVLKVANRTDIPVYYGCEEPLLGVRKSNGIHYHGTDGLGDVPDSSTLDKMNLKDEHAVQALLRMSRQFEGELTLVCLGPLTNIAVALRIDPCFGTRLKNCFIMGGNHQGRGNVTVSAEFNFNYDPEAAFIVLSQLQAPTTIVTWELSTSHSLPKVVYNKLRSEKTKKAEFLKRIEVHSLEFNKQNDDDTFNPCDAIAMAAALDHSIIIMATRVYATVEVKGQYTSGQMIVDWSGQLKKEHNITLITSIDDSKLLQMMYKTEEE
ncbi:hypothetical protein CHS0354_037552 [Potamilus streckersoni]|uniref:Inosine/uridine-preferring nucleoside hydrolase domain-containing protein n=1 Tax=Potamilus streckersoni TaxID=2493646 RepID=A0AAE0VVF7_9BIVA|nr:hypothetical protein CHS0354_037552 [Potamilus streckersoni]